jgi:hypothetical protein
VGHLGLQGPINHSLGHLIQQTVHAIQRRPGDLRIGQQRIDGARIEHLGQPARGLGLQIIDAGVLTHEMVPSQPSDDHIGRSWSIRGLHTCHDTPTPPWSSITSTWSSSPTTP